MAHNNMNNTQGNRLHEESKNDVLCKIKTELSSDEDLFDSESESVEEGTEKCKKHEIKRSLVDTPIKIEANSDISITENPIACATGTDNCDILTSTQISTEDVVNNKFVTLASGVISSENEKPNISRKKKRKKNIVNCSEIAIKNGKKKSSRLPRTIRNNNSDNDYKPTNKIKKNKLREKREKVIERKVIARNKNKRTKNLIEELSVSEIPDPPVIIQSEPEKYECVICGFESETNKSHEEHLLTHPPSDCECSFAHCHQIFPDGLILETHYTIAHGDGKQFACILCDKAFRVELNRDRHVMECTKNNINTAETDSILACEFCDARFRDDIEFKIHLGAHIHEGIYNCQLCKRKFEDQQSLDEHLILHTKFNCEQCDKSYVSKRSLVDHQRLKHTDRRLICSLCKRTFKDEKMLKEHSKRHNEPKDFKCSQCDKEYSTKHCLKDHIRRKHMPDVKGVDEKFNFCTVCEKRISPGGMLRHMMFHNKVKPFVCKFCEKRFQDRAKLNEHVRIHYGVKPCICTECGKAFRTKSELRTHFVVHITPGDPNYKDLYQTCPVCNQYTASIQKHMRAYHVKEPVICETCGKTFSSRASYTEHIPVHTNSPKHTCEICKRTFSRKWNMLSHRERHSNEKYSARYVKKCAEEDVTD